MSDEKWTRDDSALVDLFDIAGDRVLTLGVVEQWTDEQCKAAEDWAFALHFQASDNDVEVPPIPPHVEALQRFDPWKADADAQMNPATAGDPGLF